MDDIQNKPPSTLSRFYVLFFIGVLMLSGVLLYVIHDNSRQLYLATENARMQQKQKDSIMFQFMYILSGRTNSLLQMYNETDVFERYELELQMAEDASEFVRIRDELKAMELSASETEALEAVLEAIRPYMPAEREAVEVLVQDELAAANTMLLEKVLPMQGDIYKADAQLFDAILNSGKEEAQALQAKRDSIQLQIYLLSICIIITSIIFLSILFHRSNLERVVEERTRELRQTLSRLKVLEGFLAICSYCKSIRTKSGRWDELEDYLQQHSNAKFTHGICPECVEKERSKLKSLRSNHGD